MKVIVTAMLQAFPAPKVLQSVGPKGGEMNHSRCKVLGHYCWDHKVKTVAGIPGWERPRRNDGPATPCDHVCELVIWADGSTNPYQDSYAEVMSDKAIEIELDQNIAEG